MKPETQHTAPGADRRKTYNPHRGDHARILYSKQKINKKDLIQKLSDNQDQMCKNNKKHAIATKKNIYY